MILGAIFDLDGVLVDTAKYHYIAWQLLADQLKIPFNEEDNEQLKGVSREESLNLLLALGEKEYTPTERQRFTQKKNQDYLKQIEEMTSEEVLPGVKDTLNQLKQSGIKLAVGSASKNAGKILKVTNLLSYFDEVVDGNGVKKAKPDPEVFLFAAEKLKLEPSQCVVFEDSHAGCLAAKTANMYCVGIGMTSKLPAADIVIENLVDFDFNKIVKEQT